MTPRRAWNFRATIIAFIVLFIGPWSNVYAAGDSWDARPLASVLAESPSKNSPIVVKVDAAWCPGCRNLDKEIFGTKLRKRVLEGRRALKVDFDDQNNRGVIERYAILGLPTVLLLAANGDEIGRVVGYPGSEKWLAKFDAVARSGDGLLSLETRYKSHTDDPAVVLGLAKTVLNRGLRKRAVALLETVTWLPTATEAQKAESLFILGRYFHRVRRQPDVARHVWRELATRYPASPWAAGAWWWYARAQAELGRHEVGEMALRSRFNASQNPRHAMAWGKYLTKHQRVRSAQDAISALRDLKVDRKRAKEIAELIGQLKNLTPAN